MASQHYLNEYEWLISFIYFDCIQGKTKMSEV